MSRDLVNPLQGLIATAGKQLPTSTGEVARARQRLERATGPSVVLADVSASMAEKAWGSRPKIAVLREAVEQLLTETAERRLVVFSTTARRAETIPEPDGGTAMHLGLQAAAELAPRHTLVISDGQPDDERKALAAAEALTGVLDVLYVGPDSDAGAIDFMRRLARAGYGRYAHHDIRRPSTRTLAQAARLMLTHARP